MSKPVIILGAGGHAKVLLDMVRRLDYPIIGVVDPGLPPGSNWFRMPVLGDDSVIQQYAIDDIQLINGVGSLPNDQGLRRRLFNQFQAQAYTFKP